MLGSDIVFSHLFDYFLGAVAASLRIAIGQERHEQLSWYRIYVTFTSSVFIAGTSGQALAEFAHMPPSAGSLIAFCFSFFAVGYVYRAYDGKVNIPYLSQFFNQDAANCPVAPQEGEPK